MSQQRFLTLLLGFMAVVLVGCGGGGNGTNASPVTSNSPTTGSPSNNPSSTPMFNSPSSTTPIPSATVAAAANVVPLTIDEGPAAVTPPNSVPAVANLMYVTLTVCVPGTQTCATVDHVQVDTGSTGLRLFASALPASFTLPQRVDANNHALVECAQFVDGYSWGPLQTADLQISGETASSLPLQIIGSSSFSTIPSACSNVGTSRNTVQSFGANGILGIANGAQDCGASCLATNLNGTAQNNLYYSCATSQSCITTTVPLNAQVQNPISFFPIDNNGSLIVLPAIPSIGAPSVNGSLVFGIGTRSNNGLGSAIALQVDPNNFEFTTRYSGANYTESYIDSGTNIYAVPNPNNAIIACSSNASGFFCPATTLNLTATLVGTNSTTATALFSIANASTLFNQNPYYTAFSDLGGSSETGTSRSSNTFAWGAPFFFGKTVFTAIEGATTPSGTATPYVAF